MNADSILAAAGVAVGVAAIYIPTRIQVRKDKQERIRQAATDLQKKIDDAVAETRRELLERLQDKENDLASMERDRNFYRQLAFSTNPHTPPPPSATEENS